MNRCFERTYLTMSDAGISLQLELERENRELAYLLDLRFADNWVIYVDGRYDPNEFPPSEETAKKIQSWKNKFHYLYETTKGRYEALLAAYKAAEGKLLDKLSASTVARFNDTPQNSGLWDDDRHTTNITQTTSETDGEPLIDRLNRIQSAYRNLMDEWCNAFAPLFGEEI